MRIRTTPSVVIRIIIWLILLIGGSYLSITLDLKYFKDIFLKIYFHLFTIPFGLVFLCLSFRAASKGGRALAKFGRVGDIPRLETNRLVKSGIYSCTRHPMLIGLMLLPFALALLIGSPTFIIFIAPLEALLIFILVITLEEYEAIKKFKDEYIEYKKVTPIFPKDLKCLRELFGR